MNASDRKEEYENDLWRRDASCHGLGQGYPSHFEENKNRRPL